jgi:hypothetical protein
MTKFAVFALAWPFLSIGLAVVSVLAFHRLLERREQRRRPAE